MARKKSGSMTIIMPIAATETFPSFLSRKKDGTPMSAAAPKQMSCLFVRLKTSFDLTRVRSRGTEMYAAIGCLLSVGIQDTLREGSCLEQRET